MPGKSLKNRAAPSGSKASQKFPGVLFDGGTVTTKTSPELTISVPTVKATDILTGVQSVQKAGLSAVASRIVSDGVVAIILINGTAGTITTGIVTYDFCIEHYIL